MQVLVLRLLTAGSVEERICAAAAGKLAVADRAITGGFFDGRTPAAQRRAYLLDLLRAQDAPAAAAAAASRPDQLRRGPCAAFPLGLTQRPCGPACDAVARALPIVQASAVQHAEHLEDICGLLCQTHSGAGAGWCAGQHAAPSAIRACCGRADGVTCAQSLHRLAARGAAEEARFAALERSMAAKEEATWRCNCAARCLATCTWPCNPQLGIIACGWPRGCCVMPYCSSAQDACVGRRGKVADAPYAALASEEESRPLLDAATAAAQLPPEPAAQDLGRGKRKRPEPGSLADGHAHKHGKGSPWQQPGACKAPAACNGDTK